MAKATQPKILVLTGDLIASGTDAVKAAIAANADGAAADIILIASDRDAALKELAELKISSAAAIKDALAKYDVTVQQNTDIQGKLNDALEINSELSTEIEKLSKVPATALTWQTASFDVEEVTYVFVIPSVHFKGKLITWHNVLDNEDLQAELIARKSGMVKPK